MKLSLVYFAQRWLGNPYPIACKMPAIQTMKYFVDNFLGEIELVFGSMGQNVPVDKSNFHTIEAFPIPKEWHID